MSSATPALADMAGRQLWARLPSQVVPISSLLADESPRLSGTDPEHVKRLAQTDGQLPPILVHRSTRRIIDGVHRLEAARLKGEQDIEATFCDCDEDAAFILAVQSNIAHGLPLTLADRTAAARRILGSNPGWSDRAVAQATGLAAVTVGAIRRRASDGSVQSHTRRGRDGRIRPLNAAEGRRLAGELITKRPDASLRQIAREAGVSTATVRDVRARLAQGQDPVPPKQRDAERNGRRAREKRPHESASSGSRPAREPMVILQRLRRDPSLRSSDIGRTLLRWLATHTAGAGKWPDFLEHLPPHSTIMVTEMARGLADTWNHFADELEQRAGVDSE